MLRLRPISKQDLPSLSDLAARCYYETFVSMGYYTHEIVSGYIDESFSLQRLETEFLKAETHYYFVDTPLHESCGYVKFIANRPAPIDTSPALTQPVYLERFYLERPFQGKGHGASMLALVEAEVRNLGGQDIWLTVWEFNKAAIGFYIKHGFDLLGKTQFCFESQGQSYVDTDLVYRKRVRAHHA